MAREGMAREGMAREGMARTIGRLTSASIGAAQRRGYYGDGGGLYLQVSAGGAKSWVFRFKQAGRLREMGLGPLHTIGLGDARKRAQQCRRARLDGTDPIAARRAARQAAQLAAASLSFAACVERYIAANKAAVAAAKHWQIWQQALGAELSAVPVQAVDSDFVLKAIGPIWAGKPQAARRLARQIEAVLDWAAAHGYRPGDNPARWHGHLETLLPKRPRQPRSAAAEAGLRAPPDPLRGQFGEPPDRAALASAALGRLLELLGSWLPGGRIEGAEYVAPNSDRGAPGAASIKVNLRSGRWADFATGDMGGDAIGLAAYLDGCSQDEAARRLARALGLAAG